MITLLTNLLGPYKKQGNEYLFSCPFCGQTKKKLSININKNVWKCWSCEKAGKTLLSIFKKLGASQSEISQVMEALNDDRPVEKAPPKSPLVLPEEYIPLQKSVGSPLHRRALKYLKDRGISAYDILRYRMGYCESGKYRGRIIIPSYDQNNQLNYFVGRDFTNTSHIKYMNPSHDKNVVVFENLIEWEYPIVLCEGVFDAISIRLNAIPLLGKTINNHLFQTIVEKKVPRVYIALDHDAAKQKLNMGLQFLNSNIETCIIDLSEKDPNVLGSAKMLECLKGATPETIPNILRKKITII